MDNLLAVIVVAMFSHSNAEFIETSSLTKAKLSGIISSILNDPF